MSRKILPETVELRDFNNSVYIINQSANLIAQSLTNDPSHVQTWRTLLDLDPSITDLDCITTVHSLVRNAEKETGYRDQFWKSEKTLKSVKIRFQVLKSIRNLLLKKGKNTVNLERAMWDLIFSAGFLDPEIKNLMRSENGMDILEAARRSADIRSRLVKNLFPRGLNEFESQTGKSRSFEVNQVISFENDVDRIEAHLTEQSKKMALQKVLVRELTIQEAPFRGCIGGDCSSISYFSRALDPNYIYFTLTRPDLTSSGHVTLALGEATDSKSKKIVPIAFVDKIQNIPEYLLPAVINAVAVSLKERGYRLAIADFQSDKFSMWAHIEKFGKTQLIARAKERLTQFKPHPHRFDFPNSWQRYSRADDKLDVYLIEPFELHDSISLILNESP